MMLSPLMEVDIADGAGQSSHLVNLEADLVLDDLAAREGGNVLQVAALALPKAGGLDGHHLQAAAHQACQLRMTPGMGGRLAVA